ncbi:YdcF family protein [Dokdonella immobilis]|uniref:Uncharacterized SAM-binding protein YcdF, DUF218 family n=1 Tax=Dokdonella immobilis TaxID=578942 RepID=A0A1I4WAH5_9GAMM|nr:YdcF family protein [Dokdonella immobilis]SFN10764.1 Uncharacterized SAM-binding protein YcdF, DUF218 family [Dokdonella immobilis]
MLTTLLSPTRLGILLALVLLPLWRWLPRWLRLLAMLPLVACVLASLPVVANQLVRWQESRVPARNLCSPPLPSTIVVLSGGISREPRDAGDFAALGEYSLRRLFAAVDRFEAHSDGRLVISGGEGQYGIAESALMGALAQRLGVPSGAISLETASRSTWQNAQFVRALAIPQRIGLVTSALHLPRAIYAFEQTGFEVCAWPADSRYAGPNSIGYYLPSSSALDKSDAAIHEMVGEAAYRMGWLRSTTRDPWAGADER